MGKKPFMLSVQEAFKKDGISMSGSLPLCENCLETSGYKNSMHIKDNPEHDEGIWICDQCEVEAGEGFYSGCSCPCMCGGNDSLCSYADSGTGLSYTPNYLYCAHCDGWVDEDESPEDNLGNLVCHCGRAFDNQVNSAMVANDVRGHWVKAHD